MLIMTQAGTVKEEKGTGLVPTFRFTPFGHMLSQIIQFDRPDINVEAKLYNLFQGLLAPLEAQSWVIFTSNWIKKVYEKGQFGHYISILRKVIDSGPIWNIRKFNLLLLDTVNLRFSYSPTYSRLFMDIWLETVNELEPEVRKLYLYEVKLSLDVTMGKIATTLQYEKSRSTIIDDVEVVALEGYCAECKQRSVLQMKITKYYWRLAHAFTPLNGLAMQCPKCNSPSKTLRLPNVWLEDHPFYN
jgi:hypothetical protein